MKAIMKVRKTYGKRKPVDAADSFEMRGANDESEPLLMSAATAKANSNNSSDWQEVPSKEAEKVEAGPLFKV